jgi:hypothetical protein
MNTSFRTSAALLLAVSVNLGACLGEDPSQNVYGVGVGGSCMIDSECNSGLECEVEHGSGTCQPHRRDVSDASTTSDASSTPTPPRSSVCITNADCPSGLECELEHGVAACVPHRSTTDSGSSADASVDADDRRDSATSTDVEVRRDSGVDDRRDSATSTDASTTPTGGALGATCRSDSDCASPLECESEHGTSTCQPHGGGSGRR